MLSVFVVVLVVRKEMVLSWWNVVVERVSILGLLLMCRIFSGWFIY